ncbi:MAG: DUF4065 domain-containing protein [Gemmobacter sp.]|jgi:uncharacterized phage-associated protein|nr:DUF4065 domain-containing protein [Gemmobacter sp.]
MYDARQIANWFVLRARKDGRKLSIMQLLKLVYIAHGWHLEMRKSPLFNNRIEAWQYGPVIPDVYSAFRRQGINVDTATQAVPAIDMAPADNGLMEDVWNIYGKLPAFRLSELTHVPGGPWDIATQTGGHYAPIPNASIQQHYEYLRLRAEAARA